MAAFSVIVPYLGKFLKVISLSMFYVDIRELKFYNILPKREDMLLKMYCKICSFYDGDVVASLHTSTIPPGTGELMVLLPLHDR